MGLNLDIRSVLAIQILLMLVLMVYCRDHLTIEFQVSLTSYFYLKDAIPLCTCNNMYCKVLSIHNNWIAVVVLQLVNQATCFGRLLCRPDDDRTKRPKHVAWLTSCKTTTAIQLYRRYFCNKFSNILWYFHVHVICYMPYYYYVFDVWQVTKCLRRATTEASLFVIYR